MSSQFPHSDRYRVITVLAPASLVFGVASVVAPFHWSLGLIPAVGIAMGFAALRQIREAPEEYTGRGVALTGIWLSLVFWTAGFGWMMLRRVSEVPYGYQVIAYETLQPNPGEQIPAAAFELQDKRVFIRGYMMPGRQQTRLKQFVLCPAVPGCPFCTPNPKPTEMIVVTFQGDLEAQYTTHLRRVGGKFTIDPAAPGGLPYRVEADYFK